MSKEEDLGKMQTKWKLLYRAKNVDISSKDNEESGQGEFDIHGAQWRQDWQNKSFNNLCHELRLVDEGEGVIAKSQKILRVTKTESYWGSWSATFWKKMAPR